MPGGGGIIPDIPAYPVEMTPLRTVLEASPASFTTFAAEYIAGPQDCRRLADAPRRCSISFRRGWRRGRSNLRLREWIANHDFVASRLKTEIYNLRFGVEKGDEVEAQYDPTDSKSAGSRAATLLPAP